MGFLKIRYLFVLSCLVLFSQAQAQIQKSRSERLRQLSAELKRTAQADLEEAVRVATLNGWSLYGLEKLDERGLPVYNTNFNNNAATTTGTVALRTTFDVDGEDMKIGLWECCNTGQVDGNVPLLTHQDITGRVTIADATAASNHTFHATHVAGTLIGEPPGGFPITSRGMAFKANIDAYGINDDSGEMAAAAADHVDSVAAGKILISNHSYGISSGYIFNAAGGGWDWYGGSSPFDSSGAPSAFGQYDNDTGKDWDNISFLAPYYLIVKAAGNENSDNPTNGSSVRNGNTGPYVLYNTAIHPAGDGIYAGGFDNIPMYGTAKNILTVGAVNNSLSITNFSSRGPTDDGRIKPDICGVGFQLWSAGNANNNSYGFANGTSMASPNVAGSLLLLQELYRDKNKVGNDSLFMKAATLKALAIHTANDLGNPGPDYIYGWGILDADDAGEIIKQDAWTDGNATAVIIEDSISSDNEEWVYEVNGVGSDIIKVTMVYADTAVTVPSNGAALVNDLDIRVTRTSPAMTFFPFTLDPANPNSNATFADNDVDNVEQLFANSVGGSRFNIIVTVEDTLVNDVPQHFSLIIEGLNPDCHANIQHKLITPPSATYTAQEGIASQATILPGREVIYQTNGRVVLKPGFQAKVQTGTGTGFFKTATGTCN